MTLTEALDTFADQLPEIRETLIEQLAYDMDLLNKPIPTGDAIYDDLQQKVYKLDVEKLTGERVRTVNRITTYLESKRNPHKYRGRITDADIEKAREYPIEELYDGHLRQGFGLCPFHDEKTPSFHVKNNRFRCYGCDAWGSSIDFVMRRDSCTFIQAVKKLI